MVRASGTHDARKKSQMRPRRLDQKTCAATAPPLSPTQSAPVSQPLALAAEPMPRTAPLQPCGSCPCARIASRMTGTPQTAQANAMELSVRNVRQSVLAIHMSVRASSTSS